MHASNKENCMLKILFVCGGNTCRSPMAQAITSRLLGDSAFIESAGVDADTGSSANPRAKEVMKEWNLNIDWHRSKDIEDLDLGTFDLIVALDSRIAGILLSEYHLDPARLRELDIRDPFGGGLEEYHLCAQKLQDVLPAVLR
jgi:protein-tyrosine phosphatase